MTRAILLAALLSGCGSASTPGLATKAMGAKYGLNTAQTCTAPDKVVRAADLALILVAREAHRAGVIDYATLARRLDHRISACLIPTPERCGAVQVAAGCSVWGRAVWVSATGPDGAGVDWRRTLVHEMRHVVEHWAGRGDPGHGDATMNGVERRAADRFVSATEQDHDGS